MKIYTITLNPAYDVHADAAHFAAFHENLAHVTSREAGGKGVNLSRALKNGGTFTVAVNVANTGDVDAKETVQLYIRDKVATLLRPMRELKGFEKILIHAGETKKVTFTVGEKELGFYTEREKLILIREKNEEHIDCHLRYGLWRRRKKSVIAITYAPS
jgi:hypothetical protein